MNRRTVLQSSSTHFVIIIALVNAIRFTQATTTISPGSLEDLDASTSPCTLTTNSTLDCSNLQLSAIPKYLPKTILQLNLSYNSFDSIDDNAFDDCCGNVTVLDLSHNQISSLNRRLFEKLKNLQTLFIGFNTLTKLEVNTFRGLTKLKRLDLRNNPIVLQGSPSQGFLVQSFLEELNLDFCNIEEIPDGTFNNMTQLKNLTLAGNPIDKSLDAGAFERLDRLLKLRIPNLTESTIYQLCEKLTGIDVINFDEFNVSCTILSDENVPFAEAIILNDPVGEPKIHSVIAAPPPTPKATTTPSTTSSSIATTQLPTAVETTTSLSQPHLNETSDGTVNEAKHETAEIAPIDIDNDTIKFILIGIFAFTTAGILVGLICRADVCSIKTKLCRSKKNNRRAPTDTVSPFEEIPLNTVNGKTTEGHG